MAKLELFICILVAAVVIESNGEVLLPAYFNLADVAKIRASATCGDEGPEIYCHLWRHSNQDCNMCDDKNPHPIENAIDGSESYWISPTLKKDSKYNQINLTLDLGREYEVGYIFITMGIAPRFAVWVLEKSTDFGTTWTPWQYFARSETECKEFFGEDVEMNITKDDSVKCERGFSHVTPFEDGEIVVSLLDNRSPASETGASKSWTHATNVRIRLLKMFELKRPVQKSKYFYSIKDISLGGRCSCNGHAEVCEAPPATFDDGTQTQMICQCQHNTCGDNCEKCCPGFRTLPWKQSTKDEPFECQPDPED